MGDAAETIKTLHNWMGEPRPRPSDQGDDDEETLQLSLGLPGGGGGGTGAGLPPAAAWRMLPARDKEMRSAAAVDTSMLSLGYSAPAFSPRSQGTLSMVPIGHGCCHVVPSYSLDHGLNKKKNVSRILHHQSSHCSSQ
jgi:auxin-responsive protein IAA